jgi:hypothetical protein
MSEIVSIITQVGFPIAACVAMGYYVKYTNDKQRDEVSSLNERHAEEMKSLSSALENNTIALTKLCEKIDKIGG